MTPPFNLRHLRALLEVARTGSISAAAIALHISQPALTQGLNKIESVCGLPLFERDSRGVYPTPAGTVFFARIESAFQYLQAMDKAVSSYSGAYRFHQLLTTAHLRALIAVVEQGSTSLAAASLNLAQPTVHRAAKEVETLTGSALFLRSSEGIDPTSLARRLARLASLAFAEIRQGVDELKEQTGIVSGHLSIGSLPLARTYLVPAAVTELLQQFPLAQVHIVDGPYEQLSNDLLHGRIDVIIGALRHPQPAREIQQKLLFKDPLHVIARADHPLAAKKQLALQHLSAANWIAPRLGTPARERFHNLFADQGLPIPQQIIECSSSVATRSLLMQSDRVALLSRRQVELELKAGLLTVLDLPLNVARPIGTMVRKSWRATRIQATFLQLLDTFSEPFT